MADNKVVPLSWELESHHSKLDLIHLMYVVQRDCQISDAKTNKFLIRGHHCRSLRAEK